MIPFPYWDLPFANQLVPRLRKFNADLKILNDVLNKLIEEALLSANKGDAEVLLLFTLSPSSYPIIELINLVITILGARES